MIPLDIRKRAHGQFRCVTRPRHRAVETFLEQDLGAYGGGFVEELFADVAAFRRGDKELASAGGEWVSVRIDKEGATLHTWYDHQPPLRVATDELLDAIVRWYDVTNRELAETLRAIVGINQGERGSGDRKFSRRIRWRTSADVDFPYEADADGSVWRVRLNDFPAAPLYALIVDGEEIEDFDDWPPWWERVSPPGACADVDRVISQLLRLPEVNAEAIAQTLGARLLHVRSSPPNEHYAGECAAGPFDKVDLRVNDRRTGRLVLTVRAGVALCEYDLLELSCATPQSPFAWDPRDDAPGPPNALIFQHPQATIRLMTRGSAIVSMEVEWLISKLLTGSRTLAITIETLEAIRRALLEYLETSAIERRDFLLRNTRTDAATLSPAPGRIGGWQLHQRGAELIVYYHCFDSYATAELELAACEAGDTAWRVRALRHEQSPWRR